MMQGGGQSHVMNGGLIVPQDIQSLFNLMDGVGGRLSRRCLEW